MQQFTITGSDRKPHTYTVQPHPAGEGTALALHVMSLAAEPIGRLIESKAAELVGSFIAKLESGELKLDDELTLETFQRAFGSEIDGLLKGIEWHAMAADVRQALGQLDGPRLIRQILRYTHRDGRHLATDAEYDLAYQANYLELFKAVGKVCHINGFAGFTSSLESGSLTA